MLAFAPDRLAGVFDGVSRCRAPAGARGEGDEAPGKRFAVGWTVLQLLLLTSRRFSRRSSVQSSICIRRVGRSWEEVMCVKKHARFMAWMDDTRFLYALYDGSGAR